ncbi:8-oxoguanine DNA glycosylase [Faecalicatena sp. AGMB00832]|uniref:8-oxoguanine DNA glycosylase n=1 Tax=Faecalicatena faecalis TaxID=2726362 RepID=A0ABS6D704_9FIRM|nr:DNA glycosylase [Faecalicatena faecalis]MBU3877382.1 8-oxoguanine DNA glycosylase [Faecalicatena faecalis]
MEKQEVSHNHKNTPITIRSYECFDIGQICESGQCFRMRPLQSGTYEVIAGDKYLKITQDGNECIFHCDEMVFEDFWKHYFDLDTQYEQYREKINPRDQYLKNAAEFGCGIRILNQDLWEMIVSFLISQQNNIMRIRRCIQNICERYGEKLEAADGTVYYGFPKAEALACLKEDELKDCNLGYRSKYVVRTARSVVNGEFSLDQVRSMSYQKAKEELLKLFGVGVKVADCICLFALHQLEAFPVDTHINQALKKHYPKGFPKRRYKGCEGVMQQYIFYYELLGKEQKRVESGTKDGRQTMEDVR